MSSITTGLKAPLRFVLTASLTAVAIALHLFKIPYPPAPFLKYDLVGVPLAVIALYNIGDAIVSSIVVFIGLLALGADIIGASMKIAAELSTFLPLAALYIRTRRFTKSARILRTAILVAITLTSRTAAMTLLNYVITPYWLMMMTYSRSWEEAYSLTLYYLPSIALFNATVVLYVVPIALSVYGVVEKVGVVIR